MLDEQIPQVGAGGGELRIALDGSADEIAGYAVITRLVRNDPQQVPGARLFGVGFENLPAEFGRFRQPTETVRLNRLR